MRLSLFKLRRMIAEEISHVGKRRLAEAGGMIPVEQFMEEVAERMTSALGEEKLSAQATGEISKYASGQVLPQTPKGVRIRRGRYNGPGVGDDTACIIIGGSTGTSVVPNVFKDQFAIDLAATNAFNDIKRLYSGATITSQGGDDPVADADIFEPIKVKYRDLLENGEDSDPPIMGFGEEYQVYVIPTNLDNRLVGM